MNEPDHPSSTLPLAARLPRGIAPLSAMPRWGARPTHQRPLGRPLAAAVALLLLAACADTTAWQAELGSFYDSLGASQESIMARGSVHLSGPPPAMDVWCYRTLARPDCLPEPLVGEAHRLEGAGNP